MVVVRPRREAVCSPNCRPIGQNTLKIGHCEALGLHFGGFGVNRGVLLTCEPLNMRVNPLMRTSTPQHAPGRRCPRASHRVHVRVKGPRCRSSGPRAHQKARVRRMRSEPEGGLTARRPPDPLYMPRDTTGAGPRRNPPLVAYGRRAVGAEKPRYQQHVLSNNPKKQVYAL